MEVIAILILVATLIFIMVVERTSVKWIQKVLNWFPAMLFAYVIPAFITHSFSLDLSEVYLHQVSRNWIIPLAIVTVMSALPMQQLKQVGVKPVLLFVSGSLIIAVLPVLLVYSLKIISPDTFYSFMKQELWKGLIPVVGSWIGGSTSQLVLKELVNTPNEIFLSVIVLDNILVNIWTLLMFQLIKRSERLNSFLGIHDQHIAESLSTQNKNKNWFLTLFTLISTIIVINFVTDNFLARVIILSVIGLILGNTISAWDYSFVLKSGSIFIIIIMAILGLRLNFGHLLLPFSFIALMIVWLLLHFLFMMMVTKVLNLHTGWAIIGSMANLGGISTAPAVTAAYRKSWMPHAIVLAILSMISGNFWGLVTNYLFKIII